MIDIDLTFAGKPVGVIGTDESDSSRSSWNPYPRPRRVVSIRYADLYIINNTNRKRS
jgi:hypothetical protein